MNLELQLQERFSSHFRRIWVQKTRFNSVCVTLFPLGQSSGYRILTREKVSRQIDFEYVESLINEFLKNDI